LHARSRISSVSKSNPRDARGAGAGDFGGNGSPLPTTPITRSTPALIPAAN